MARYGDWLAARWPPAETSARSAINASNRLSTVRGPRRCEWVRMCFSSFGRPVDGNRAYLKTYKKRQFGPVTLRADFDRPSPSAIRSCGVGGTMRFPAIAFLATLAAAGQAVQSDAFKLGRFSQGGRTFLGVVVDDKTVAEIPASARSDLKGIIGKYPSLRPTLRDLAVKARAGKGAGVYDLKSLDTLAPIPDPLSVLNAAVNYVEHGNEMAR